jgi:hypothetical protein
MLFYRVLVLFVDFLLIKKKTSLLLSYLIE